MTIESDVRVLIAEDDLYARDMMALLLTRDWRVQVVDEVGTGVDDVMGAMADEKADVILLSTDMLGSVASPIQIVKTVRAAYPEQIIVCIGARVNASVARRMQELALNGYLLKHETRYSLARAVLLAAKGACVVTPEVMRSLYMRVGAVVTLTGSRLLQNLALSPNGAVNNRAAQERRLAMQKKVARLSILFNLEYQDIADELSIERSYARDLVSRTYRDIELSDILDGEVDPEHYFDHEEIIERFYAVRQTPKHRRKSSEQATLAFHLITVPDIE